MHSAKLASDDSVGATTSDNGGDQSAGSTDTSNAAATAVPVPAQQAATTATPAQADPTARPPLPPLPVAEQIAINVKQAISSATDQIQIQLTPASLGAIDVKLNVGHDGRVTAVITADRSDTLNLLKQDSSGLQQALRNAGLQADSGSLSFNLRGDGQSYQNQQGSAQGGSRGNSGGSARISLSAGAPSASVAAAALRRHAGKLDIHV